MRKQLIAGNWKMNMHLEEATSFAGELMANLRATNAEVAIFPPFPLVYPLVQAFKDSSVAVGAQNVSAFEKGAYTGEVAASMLADVGATYVIIGHSERRDGFFETNEIVRDKIKQALEVGLKVILCVGESLAIRESGEALAFIDGQVEGSLAGITVEEMAHIAIAYEPIWAIGTGKTATAEEAEEVCASIRKKIEKLYGTAVAEDIRVLYGGSVKGSNAKEILGKVNIDGALVGGASLKAMDFIAIIEGAM